MRHVDMDRPLQPEFRGMHEDPVPRQLTRLTESTREALTELEQADAAEQRREGLARVQARFAALRQVESSHVEPLLFSQTQTRGLAAACRKERNRVTPLLNELNRTPVSDPGFRRVLGRFAEALRRLLDRILDVADNIDRVLSPEHRALLAQALDQSSPA